MSPFEPALAALAALALLFTAVWRLSVHRSDAGIIDVFWAPGFVLVGLVEATLVTPLSATGLLLLALTGIWATRLALYLLGRHRRAAEEDARYAAMREAGGPEWPRRSLYTVFLVQALALWAIATPLHAALLPGAGPVLSIPLAIAGGLIFLVGFGIETIADAQLARFKSNPDHHGRLLTGGLYAFCRHPNYLGEILVWWGLGLVAYGLSDRWWALIGPALLTYFILKVSGIPPLEVHLSRRPGFADWAARTPALWPRWGRSGSEVSNEKGS